MTDPAFVQWLKDAGFLTATSDTQLALYDAWSAGAARLSAEITTLASGDKLPEGASNNAKIVESALERGRVLSEWAARIARQVPEKPDYWTPCGQCDRNTEEAQDLRREGA